MAESFIQAPPDSTGKKLRTRERTIGANQVHEQAFFNAAAETWVAYVDAVAFAANKHHLTLFNSTGSGKVVKARKLFAVNLQNTAVTGVWARFDIKKATGITGGTVIIPTTMDSANAALPGQIAVRTNATVNEGALLFPWITSNEEETPVNALSKTIYQQATNALTDGNEIQELTLREGEGFTVKQITSTTVGSYGWILLFTVE